jgi:hypothetical protein
MTPSITPVAWAAVALVDRKDQRRRQIEVAVRKRRIDFNAVLLE